jgi:hypothetical protein
LLACTFFVVPAWSAAKRIVVPSPLQVCLDAEGRTAGLGDYWSAKSLIFSSDRRIHVAQLTSDGSFYHANFNNRWFANRADGGGTFRPDFIIPTNLDAERLRRVFGFPDRVRNCGGQDVWLYHASLLSFPRDLEKRAFTAADRTRVGRLEDQELISTGQKGLLYSSKYAMIDAGSYDLTVYGSGAATTSTWIDVVSEKGRMRHAKFELSRSNDAGVLLKGSVNIERAVSDLELRVYVGKQDVVRLTGFELRAR